MEDKRCRGGQRNNSKTGSSEKKFICSHCVLIRSTMQPKLAGLVDINHNPKYCKKADIAIDFIGAGVLSDTEGIFKTFMSCISQTQSTLQSRESQRQQIPSSPNSPNIIQVRSLGNTTAGPISPNSPFAMLWGGGGPPGPLQPPQTHKDYLD